MTTRLRHGPSGFTVLIRDGGAYFCQIVHHLTPGYSRGSIVLNIFERFGEDGIANKVWRRLDFPALASATGVQSVRGVDPIMPVPPLVAVEPLIRETDETRLIRFVRPLAFEGGRYRQEFKGLRITDESPGQSDGTLPILFQITVSYTHILRSEF